jgi:hypothetical protein
MAGCAGAKRCPATFSLTLKNRRKVYFSGKTKDSCRPFGRTLPRFPLHWRNFMIDRRFFVSELCAFSLSVAILPIASSSTSFAAALAALDKDNDGTLDLAEVKDAAGTVFDKLDKDSDATLDRKETGGRVGEKEFKEADADHDGTLTKDEYLGLVEKLFNAADVDNDGTLTAKELKSKTGRALLRVIQP